MRARIIKPDYTAHLPVDHYANLFLAGSIEQGKAEDWQTKVCQDLVDYELNIYSPRRLLWNPELEQSIQNDQFREQVVWEQKYLRVADFVLMNFCEDTKSPISLLELGQLSRQQNTHTIVVCPKSFWRRGNVEVVCTLFKMPLYETLEEGLTHLKTVAVK